MKKITNYKSSLTVWKKFDVSQCTTLNSQLLDKLSVPVILSLVYASVNVCMYVVPPPLTDSNHIRSHSSSMHHLIAHVTRGFVESEDFPI